MSIGKSKIIGFNAKQLVETITTKAVQSQTERFIEYAKKEIQKLGDMIQTYNSANHMDRTGNLLNSLCWCVTYCGEVKGSGFYRPAVTNKRQNRWGQERGMGMNGGSGAALHEFFRDSEIIDGRKLAEDFLSNQAKTDDNGEPVGNGWRVVFAVLAPYWGYWESGFTMTVKGNSIGFYQFAVMTHIYDDVRMDLKPAKTRLSVYVPKYIYKSKKWSRKLKNRVGIPKF